MNFDYLIDNWRRVLELTREHLQLTAIALLLAIPPAIVLGVIITAFPKLRISVLGLLGAIYTIPSLAFLAMLIPSLGLGRQPAVFVLAAYAQLALVRNVQAGLSGVDTSTLEAGRGVGMTAWQSFWKVRFPLALPILIAGLRIATVTTISLATITAWIDAGGLGTLLFDGITFDNPSMILAGTVAITALALTVDLALRGIERLTPAARSARAART
jgi:osmoprotectant transport system permease protein